MEDQASKSNTAVYGLIVLVLLLGGIGASAWWLSTRADDTANAADNQSAGASSAIPSLGSHGRPTPDPLPETNSAPDNAESGDGAEDGSEDANPQPERQNTAREIDIWLYNLGVATKARDGKGMKIDHELLTAARPHTLVDERVRNALDNEENALVRIQFFAAFHELKPKLDWAQHVYDSRTAKFLGTDEMYAAGEVEELKLIASYLLDELTKSWHLKETPDEHLMSLLRNVLDTEKPDWLLKVVARALFEPIVVGRMASFANSLQQELRNLLLRRSVARDLREIFFAEFIVTFDPVANVFTELERPEWWDYASTLMYVYGPRQKPAGGQPVPNDDPVLTLHSFMEIDLFEELKENTELPKLFERLLQGNMDADNKRLLIQRIAAYDVPNGRAMIEAGLQTKDANYPDYLVAFGSFASNATDLQRLTGAADDADVKIAQGGIEGLRQSRLGAADTELRKVLEQGVNPGVKSQALGALLSRSTDKSALIEEYLDVNKDPSLRAVAVSHIPESNLDRLQEVVEEDPSLRVRQAALNRVGAVRPDNVPDRKRLRAWFLSIKERDASPVIRSAARKFAEALKE